LIIIGQKDLPGSTRKRTGASEMHAEKGPTAFGKRMKSLGLTK